MSATAPRGLLELRFPWGEQVEVLSPSSLSARQRKYLLWCLSSPESGPRNLRLLSLLGFLTYHQTRFAIQEMRKWP